MFIDMDSRTWDDSIVDTNIIEIYISKNKNIETIFMIVAKQRFFIAIKS
jgi:hypothetical protein